MQELTLHETHYSGNCYKIRLTAALIGIRINKLIEYDILKGQTRTPEYLSNINANGRVPVLQIGENIFLPESGAACYYLATGSNLIPTDRLEHAEMLQWMFFEQYSHEPHVATLRFWTSKVGLENLNEEQRQSLPMRRRDGKAALQTMDQHLSTRPFFAAGRLTLADIVLYAYTHVADAGGFDLDDFPSVKAWCERVSKQEGYISITQ